MTSTREKTHHRPGLMVVERRHWTVLNLDDGECRPVEFGQLTDIWTAPELRQEADGPVAEPVESASLRDSEAVDPSRIYIVNEPTVLRLDSGRVLSWSHQDNIHVELTPSHLHVLELLRSPARVADLDPVGPEAELLLGQLLAISLVIETYEEPTVAPPSAESGGEGNSEDASGVNLADLDGTDMDRAGAGPRDSALSNGGDSASPDQTEPVTEGPLGAIARAVTKSRLGMKLFGSARSEDPTEQSASVSETPTGGGQASSDPRVPVIPLYRWPMMGQNSGVMMQVEPSLSTGMIFAAARHYDGGRLSEKYDLRKLRPDAFEVLAEWEQNPRPSIFAFSDYLWNTEIHLELSERVKQASPNSLCIHGGPNVPKYEDELNTFFRDNPSVDMVAHGEGELTFSEILDVIDGDLDENTKVDLSGIAGISFRSKTGDGADDYEIITTAPRARSTGLEEFPSPYLTGEFDDLLSAPWRSASFETNRGCPYGCTFCDWGSNTNSRIRKFDLDRIKAEMTWAIKNGAPADVYVADANVGIFARDVEIAEHIAFLRQTYGLPFSMTFSLAKNTVKYSKEIIRIIVQAGILPMTATSAVQSVDPATLRAVERQNIKVEKYEELEAIFAEQGVPLMTDILMGLPGSTFESFKNDLQHCLEREVTPRTMEIIMLPNSPMNAPNYREKWELVVDDDGVLVGCSTYSSEDYKAMAQLRLLYRAFDHFGILRHLLHFLEWEHGIRGVDLMDRINRTVNSDVGRYPLLSFVARQFDIYTAPPVGWDPFFDEVKDFLLDAYGIEADTALCTVLDLQKALLPFHGRKFPEVVTLDHDYSAYRSDRLAIRRGQATEVRPLKDYPPMTMELGDPGRVCDEYIVRNDYAERRSASTGNLFWIGYDWELDSPFPRHTSTNIGRFERQPA
ncbi:MAG: radical SAM protein [Microthrixaceae bacterium]